MVAQLIRLPRHAGIAAGILAFKLAPLWSGLVILGQSPTNSGTVNVEIVPPGSFSETENPSPAAPGSLSAAFFWMPDSPSGQPYVRGTLAVQDHRASADGWTVRLKLAPPASADLVSVDVGVDHTDALTAKSIGISAQDMAVGTPLRESPVLVTAIPRHGYGLTLHTVTVEIDPETVNIGEMLSLVVIIPSAP